MYFLFCSDAFVIMDLLWRLKPDLVIELGTAGGGSAFYYATIMNAYSTEAHVLTIDPLRVRDWNWQNVNRVCPHCIPARETNLWKSGAIEFYNEYPSAVIEKIKERIAVLGSKNIIVIEDSNHKTATVLENLELYSQFVSVGSFYLVQDTKMSYLGNQSSVSPKLAIKKFLKLSIGQNFAIDRTYEYYHYSQHVGGFLKRVK